MSLPCPASGFFAHANDPYKNTKTPNSPESVSTSRGIEPFNNSMTNYASQTTNVLALPRKWFFAHAIDPKKYINIQFTCGSVNLPGESSLSTTLLIISASQITNVLTLPRKWFFSHAFGPQKKTKNPNSLTAFTT